MQVFISITWTKYFQIQHKTKNYTVDILKDIDFIVPICWGLWVLETPSISSLNDTDFSNETDLSEKFDKSEEMLLNFVIYSSSHYEYLSS